MALSFGQLANLTQNYGKASTPQPQAQPINTGGGSPNLNISPNNSGSIAPGSLPAGMNLNASGSLYNGPAQTPAPFTPQTLFQQPNQGAQQIGSLISKVSPYVAPIASKISKITPQPIKDFGSGLISNPGDTQPGKKVDFGSTNLYDLGQYIGSGMGGDLPIGHLVGEAGKSILHNLPQVATGVGLAFGGLKDIKGGKYAAKTVEEAARLTENAKLAKTEGAATKVIAKETPNLVKKGDEFVPATETAIKNAPRYAVPEGDRAANEVETKLAALGYKPEQISKIDRAEAQKIIEEGRPGFLHPTADIGRPPIVQPPSFAEQAGARAAIAEEMKKGNVLNRVKSLPDDAKNIFVNWVNNRAGARIEAIVASKPFRVLDSQGIDAFIKRQTGNNEGALGQVAKYFETKYNTLKAAGLDIGHRADYLPQLWKDNPKEVEARLGKSLTENPSFTLQRVFKDYQEGIDKGLTPRYNKMSDLVGWYEGYANKALADREFFQKMLREGYVQPGSKIPAGQAWTTIDPDRFPKYLSNFAGGGKYVGVYKAPDSIAKVINNYLKAPSSEVSGIARFVSKAKNLALSSGVPKTGFNAHGVNMLGRYTLSSSNPVKGLAKGLYYLARPEAAAKHIDQSLERLAVFVKHGLNVSTEEHAFSQFQKSIEGNLIQKGIGKISAIQEKFFEDPLFKKGIPAMKMDIAEQTYKNLIKTMPEEQALRKASEVANTLFGGINLEQLGRSKEFQNIMRTIVLAPDYAESTIRTGGNIAKGLTTQLRNPEYTAYRTFARNLAFAYISANMINKASSGHYMFQNPAGQQFNVDTGTKSGEKQRYVKVFGTSVDFARLPAEAVAGLVKGDPTPIIRSITNRFSIPLSSAMHIFANQDFLGRKIYGSQNTGLQNTAGIANEAVRGAGLPQLPAAALDVATGKANLEQAASQTLEAPVVYRGANTKSGASGSGGQTPVRGRGATRAKGSSGGGQKRIR